jgi:hypothetical protein
MAKKKSSVKGKSTKVKKRKTKKKVPVLVKAAKSELLILSLISIIALLLWDTSIVYPIKLFVVALHEISHAIVTIFTGGSVIGMDVNSGLYGTVNSEGGSEFLIASAGYLGSLIWGFLIFISADNKKLNVILSTSLSVILVLFIANFFSDPVAIIILLLYAVFFYVAPRYIPPNINYWAMRTLGLLSSFYVIFDIKEDLLTSEYLATDADRLAMLTTIPAIYWGLIWFSISLIVIYLMFKKAYYKNIF